MTPSLVLTSTQDESINYIFKEKEGQFEARYVQRVPEYAIVYLSSHTGCNYNCRFCHLTQMGETSEHPASIHDYFTQAHNVVNKIPFTEELKLLHYNFMARGEPLNNKTLVNEPNELFEYLDQLSIFNDVKSRFLISSIIPKDFSGSLNNIFEDERSTLYYSLYSLNPVFRNKWLPKAMNPYKALDLIAEMQYTHKRDVVFHWAFIEGHNTSEEELYKIADEVHKRDLKVRFNLVRYNPHNNKCGTEPSEENIIKLFNVMDAILPHPNNKIVSRVGFDVKASCGMFA